MPAMEDSKHQLAPEDASICYMFQVCLLAFMRNADQPNFHDSLSLFDSLAVRSSRVRAVYDWRRRAQKTRRIKF